MLITGRKGYWKLVQKFKDQYNTEPGLTGFTGFDVTYYFLSSLFYVNKRFQRCISDFPMEMTQNVYQFVESGKHYNYENKGGIYSDIII